MSKEAKKEVVVCDGKDNDNTCGLVHIGSVYQGGDVEGHFLKFQDNKLISIAERNDKNKIKLQKFESDDNDELYLITDPNSDRALKCNIKDGGTSSFTVEQSLPDKTQTKYNEVIKREGFLFKKTERKKKDGAGESQFYLYSYKRTSKEESLVLAVDEGSKFRMDSPPELKEVKLLNDDDSKYLFRMYPNVQGCHKKK